MKELEGKELAKEVVYGSVFLISLVLFIVVLCNFQAFMVEETHNITNIQHNLKGEKND